jgi:hypothetical protein
MVKGIVIKRLDTLHEMDYELAHVLIQEMRRRLARTPLAAAQVCTLRERPLKVAVLVKKSARRIVLNVSMRYP